MLLHRWHLPGPGLHRPGKPALGSSRPRHHRGAHPGIRPARDRPGRHRGHGVPDPRRRRGDDHRNRHQACGACASTAGPRPWTQCCNSKPTISTSRCTDPSSKRSQPSVPPTSPASLPTSGHPPRRSASNGNSASRSNQTPQEQPSTPPTPTGSERSSAAGAGRTANRPRRSAGSIPARYPPANPNSPPRTARPVCQRLGNGSSCRRPAWLRRFRLSGRGRRRPSAEPLAKSIPRRPVVG